MQLLSTTCSQQGTWDEVHLVNMIAEVCLPFGRGEPDAQNNPAALMAVPTTEWKHRVPTSRLPCPFKDGEGYPLGGEPGKEYRVDLRRPGSSWWSDDRH